MAIHSSALPPMTKDKKEATRNTWRSQTKRKDQLGSSPTPLKELKSLPIAIVDWNKRENQHLYISPKPLKELRLSSIGKID